jgi:putative Mn2+ efflux pump MntP
MVMPPPVNSFPKQAALFSLLAPFVGLGLSILGQPVAHGAALFIIGCVSILLILAGFVLGIVALFGIKTHGKKGILVRALAGVCINGFLILMMLIAIPRLVQQARAAQAQQTGQQH